MKSGWVTFLAVGAVVVAIAWPAAAGRVALALVTAAGAVIAVPALVALRRRYPLHPVWVGPPRSTRSVRPPDKPNQLVVLERSLATGSGSGTISFVVREQLRASARRRLVEHHRLDPNDPADQPAIRRLVSDDLWRVVGPVPRDPAGRPRQPEPVAVGALESLVDEIRAL